MSSSDFSGTTTSGSSYYSSTTSFGNPRTGYETESSSHSGYERVPPAVIADIDRSLVELADELGTPIFAGVRRADRRDRRGRLLYRARALAQEVGRGRFETAGRGTGARPREALVAAIADIGAGIRAGQRKKLARTIAGRFHDRRSSDDTPILFLPGPQPPAASQKTAPAPNFGPPYVPGSVYARRR